jgi:hypothetical protein
MNNIFHSKFHCKKTTELAKNSFEINGVSYDVPCVFQIWEKLEEDRMPSLKVKEVGFTYVDSNFHIAFRRVGGLAGKCYNSGEFSRQSHYFLKFNDVFIPHISSIMQKINSHKFPSNTVGPRSLSKTEVNEVINKILNP